MPPLGKLPVLCVLLWWAPLAIAQNDLGALLDAGPRKLSPEEFKVEIVQRMIVGPTPTGGIIEIMYTGNGLVQGTGSPPASVIRATFQMGGDWTIDGQGRICTTLRALTPTYFGVSLPPRCQYWFKLGDTYFTSDSDSDRSAKVFSRTVKQ